MFFHPNRVTLLIILSLSLSLCREANAQFANGADVSWLSEMENDGYVFKDNSGVQKNCLEILKEKGINALRFRVWVNPQNGYNGIKDVANKSYIADSMGFKIMLDFHYSDSWADPGKQYKPAAWANDSLPQLLTDIYNHTYDVLDTLKSMGITPKWVQIGNEVDDGMLWETGRASTHMSNFAAMLKSGYKAVKDIDTSIQVIIHLSRGNDDGLYRWMFDNLKKDSVKWDIIGMSVYPYWVNLPWAEDDSLVLMTMKDVIARYKTKVMVCEAGYLYNKPIDANHFLLDLIAKTKSVGGLGVFYWEPECYNWQNYNLGAWDPYTKEPTAALDAFPGISATAVTKGKSMPTGYNLEIYPNPFNPDTKIEYTVPRSSNISIAVYDMLGREVTSLKNGYQHAGNYRLTWSAGDVSSGVYFCRMKSENFVETKKIILLK